MVSKRIAKKKTNERKLLNLLQEHYDIEEQQQ